MWLNFRINRTVKKTLEVLASSKALTVSGQSDIIWQERPPLHSYCFAMIQLFIKLVFSGPTSIRGASGVLRLFAPLLLQLPNDSAPSPNGGCNWLLRLGLYELKRPLEKADDWIWIIDHTIQVGNLKCFLIVGFRLSHWQSLDRPLAHKDLTVIALEPSETSVAEVIAKDLCTAASRTGAPLVVLSDQGLDLGKGFKLFAQDYPEVSHIHDAKHKLALFLKRILEKDSHWTEFCKLTARVRKDLRQDSLQFLTPPAMKTKARYMNLEELVNWGVTTRRFLENPKSPTDEPLNIGKLNITLKWLKDYDDSLTRWAQLMAVIRTSMRYLREHGYHKKAADDLRDLLRPFVTLEDAIRMVDSIIDFVKEESLHAKDQEHLPASSEIIESLIGKGKRVEGQQSRSGFTRMVLAMAAAVVTPTKEFITNAFQAVKSTDVTTWTHEKIGVSQQAMRVRVRIQTCGTETG
jgi:hypothetical protein